MITAFNVLIGAIGVGALACFAVWVWLQPTSIPEFKWNERLDSLSKHYSEDFEQ